VEIARSVSRYEESFLAKMHQSNHVQNYLNDIETKRKFHQYLSQAGNDVHAKFAELRSFGLSDRLISAKKFLAIPLSKNEVAREEFVKKRKIANLASITRTITSKLLLGRST
jgi:hypothetical protein